MAIACWRFWQIARPHHRGPGQGRRVLAMPGWADDNVGVAAARPRGGGGWPTGRRHGHREPPLRGGAVTEARRSRRSRAARERPVQPLLRQVPTLGVDDWTQALAEDDTSLLDEAIEIWNGLGDEYGVAKALWGLGEHHAYRHEHEQAEEVLTRALGIFERRSDAFWVGWTRFTRSFSRALAGRLAEAASDEAVALREFRASRDVSGAVLLMSATSSMLLMAGRPADGHAVGAAASRATPRGPAHRQPVGVQRDPTPVPEPRRRTRSFLHAGAEGGRGPGSRPDRANVLADEWRRAFGDASRPAYGRTMAP